MTRQTGTPAIVARQVCRRVYNHLTFADDPEPSAEIVHIRPGHSPATR